MRRVLGPENPATLQSAGNLVAALAHLGRLDEAGTLAHETLESSRRSLDETHPMTRFALYASASVSALRGQKGQALDLLRQASAAGDELADLPGDADFRSLRGEPEFDRLVAGVKSRAAATAQNKP